jgi:RecA/RadA recombinase
MAAKKETAAGGKPKVTVKKAGPSPVAEGQTGPLSFAQFLAKEKSKFKVLSGEEAINKLNVKTWVPTGILPIDILLGGLGIPTGHAMLLSSETSEGKTLIALILAIAFQRQGGAVYIIQREGGALGTWMKSLGMIANDQLIVPENVFTYEEAFAYMEKIIRYQMTEKFHQPAIIIFDSITAMEPGANFEKEEWIEILKSPELKARISSAFLPRLLRYLLDSNVFLCAISQLRENISKNPRMPARGPKRKTSGGDAWPFDVSLHIRIRAVKGGEVYPYAPSKGQKGKEYLMGKDRVHEPVGKEIELFGMKSRTGPPERKAFVKVIYTPGYGYQLGIDPEDALLTWYRDRGLIGKYTGKDPQYTAKDVKDAVREVCIDDVAYPFIGIRGWKELLQDAELREKLETFARENANIRGIRDKEEDDSGDETIPTSSSGDEPIPGSGDEVPEVTDYGTYLDNLGDEAPGSGF